MFCFCFVFVFVLFLFCFLCFLFLVCFWFVFGWFLFLIVLFCLICSIFLLFSGLDSINLSYIPLLQAVLRCKQCVGIIGGRESSSFYFFGYRKDDVLILDPHTTQPAFEKTDHPIPLDSFHPNPTVMSLNAVDPSVSVGFLLTKYEELEALEAFFAAETSHLAYSITIVDSMCEEEETKGPLSAELDDWVAL